MKLGRKKSRDIVCRPYSAVEGVERKVIWKCWIGRRSVHRMRHIG